MNTKKTLRLSLGLGFSFMMITFSFQNCAQQLDLASVGDGSALSASEAGSNGPEVQSKSTPLSEGIPTDSKQTLESMMSLTGLTRADINMTEINGEINYRRNLLAPQSDISMINSPAVIAITSLAGVVCKQAVAKEKKAGLDMFKYMSFTKGPSAYGKVGAINTYSNLIKQFWLRNPTVEEVTIITQTVEEYFATLDSAALGKATESEKLAIFICAGVLSVPESYLM
ncbi:MAG: hypothetical protein ACKOX6_03595 [Bdellovibrio sp.]